MNRLDNKKIYYIITGASKAKFASRIIKEMISEGAKVYTIPTPAGLGFIRLEELQKIVGNTVKINWDDKIKLPKITKALNLKAQDVW
ncbi:MAG: flavoprotein [Bacillota bacterium]